MATFLLWFTFKDKAFSQQWVFLNTGLYVISQVLHSWNSRIPKSGLEACWYTYSVDQDSQRGCFLGSVGSSLWWEGCDYKRSRVEFSIGQVPRQWPLVIQSKDMTNRKTDKSSRFGENKCIVSSARHIIETQFIFLNVWMHTQKTNDCAME